MDDVLASVIAEALEQADELPDLDAVRAEVWASDLVALAAEAGPDGPARLVEALATAGGPGPAAALWAIDAVSDLVDLSDPALEPAPSWADHLLTSTCEGAWLLRGWRGASAAFRFVDAADDRHVVLVDLVPGAADAAETVGEVRVGPAELLDVVDEDGAGLSSQVIDPATLAGRVAAAMRATPEPAASFVAAGRVVIARLERLGVDGIEPPEWIEPVVPEPPVRDPEDDAFARQVLDRALGSAAPVDAAATTMLPGLAEAAASLRAAAAADEPLAQWLAASVGPVDLDEPDLDVVLAALAAVVAPADLTPLAPEVRTAVVELEWADWLGVVIGLVRGGSGTSTDPRDLVDLVNRCPEVTSTIPKADRDRVAWAFAVCTAEWPELGVVVDGAITEFGVAVLPAALRRAWQAF